MKHIEWGFLIISYLFLGGLSAGMFFVSALATFFVRESQPGYERVARYGAILAPWPVAFGCGLLVFDLGRWYTFYKLFIHFRWTSPMSIGSWLLVLFSAVCLLACYAWLTERQRASLFARLPKALQKYNRDLSHLRRKFALFGAPLSVGVGIYTGVLLGAVQSRPFWNTNLVAQLFLFSALSTGSAALIFALALRRSNDMHAYRLLYLLDILFMSLEFFIVLPYIIHGQLSVQAVQDALQLILGGPFTLLFWLIFMGLGLLLPLALETSELVPALINGETGHYNAALAGSTALLVLVGGFVLRYIFVYAGQISAFH